MNHSIHRYRSSDGLVSSDNPEVVAQWDRIGADMAQEQRRATAELRELGVKLEHPDDGWVDRERNTIKPCYPAFDDGPDVGDLIALGWPWMGEYRLVRVTRIERTNFLIPTVTYHFTDTGARA